MCVNQAAVHKSIIQNYSTMRHMKQVIEFLFLLIIITENFLSRVKVRRVLIFSHKISTLKVAVTEPARLVAFAM